MGMKSKNDPPVVGSHELPIPWPWDVGKNPKSNYIIIYVIMFENIIIIIIISSSPNINDI